MNVNRPIACILADLDHLAARIIAAPYVAFGDRFKLIDLRTEIENSIARPAIVRVIDDMALMLALCLVNIARNGESNRWLEIAKVLHPYVQMSLKAAHERKLQEMLDHS